MWLLIVCLSYTAPYCDYRGGVSTALVSEAQCKAMLEDDGYKTGARIRCVSPDGKIIDGKWKN